MLVCLDQAIVWEANIFCNIIHHTIQIDEILGDSSSAEDGSNEALEVSPPMENQNIANQNINNERELSTTTTNNNNEDNNSIEFTNWQRRNINAHAKNFGSQNSSTL